MLLAASPLSPHVLSGFPVLSRFLARPQLLTRYAPLPWEGHRPVYLGSSLHPVRTTS
jgi:hypothetical protein